MFTKFSFFQPSWW